jgi:DNA adenine methylase
MRAPFPYFGGKSSIAKEVWNRFGSIKQYIEPFCGSAAILLTAPKPASLEVVNDINGFIANFWRAVKNHPDEVAKEADYPVSHIDLGARHVWLMDQRERLGIGLHDPNWIGDAKAAGWWLWGQCCWIGSGWCEWEKELKVEVSDAGMGVQAIGRIPHISDAGMGVQAIGMIPHISNAGMGVQAIGKIPHVSDAGMGDMLTSSGRTALVWLRKLADRLERVRITHGSWDRCLNNHYGKNETAVFLDPPYENFEALYGSETDSVSSKVKEWAVENQNLKVALCGLENEHVLPGWSVYKWERSSLTYGGSANKNSEVIWFSPACNNDDRQINLF